MNKKPLPNLDLSKLSNLQIVKKVTCMFVDNETSNPLFIIYLNEAEKRLGLNITEEQINHDDDVIKDKINIVKSEVNKLSYADCIIRNIKGDILLLQRSYNDDFMPGKWCLPGGKIELGEDPMQAAIRECQEETNIELRNNLDLNFIGVIDRNDSSSFYYEIVLTDPPEIILDNKEHYRQEFVPLERIQDYDLILDLKDLLLNKFILTEINKSFTEKISFNNDNFINSFESLQKSLANKTISEDQYKDSLIKLQSFSFNLIKKAFDIGRISIEKYHNAYFKLKT